MSPADPKHPWSRLAAAARHVQESRDEAAPYGFATRVSALAFARANGPFVQLERLAFRAVGVACALALVSVVVNYPALQAARAQPAAATIEQVFAADDAIAVVWEATEVR